LKAGDNECIDMVGYAKFNLQGDWTALEDPYLYIIQKVIKEHPETSIRLAEFVFSLALRRQMAEERKGMKLPNTITREPIETWIEYSERIKDKDPVKEVLALKPLATKAKIKFVRKHARISRRKTSA
jgi:hypothetical protein